jgi:hypothetical protein
MTLGVPFAGNAVARFSFELKDQRQAPRPRPPVWVLPLTVLIIAVVALTLAAMVVAIVSPSLLTQWFTR